MSNHSTADVPGFPVVALVTSAGGLNALCQVLSPLPADLPAAVVVVQHQQPDHTNHLTALLDRSTALTVTLARENDTLTPGHVLVAPPGRHVLISAPARIGLIDSGAIPPARPSADLLLATLAVTCGPRALAVVLTGRGTDAQAGIRAVAHYGGTVFAQDQASSAYGGMPAAAADTGLVQAVLPLPDLAAAILAHVRDNRHLRRS
ncbi:chemotaxis protein CheB [Actinophytocola sp.]|uniref:chemotaxis protein CheB n=1 Tax=Actinophytocola sp. TaxID=1872138 RepID=UPI00389AB136